MIKRSLILFVGAILPAWPNASLFADSAWSLETSTACFKINQQNGEISAVYSGGSGLASETADVYVLETENETKIGSANKDRVLDSSFDANHALILKCHNDELGFDVEKRYIVANGELVKNVRYSARFIPSKLLSIQAYVKPDGKLAENGNAYVINSNGGWIWLDRNSPTATWRIPLKTKSSQYIKPNNSMLLLASPGDSLGLAVFKSRVNGKYDMISTRVSVWGVEQKPPDAPALNSRVDPSGCYASMTSDFIGQGRSFSLETVYRPFIGDVYGFIDSYLLRPELDSVLRTVKHPSPNVFRNIKCISMPIDMWADNVHLEKDRDRLKLLNEKLEKDEYAVSTFWCWNWTGDYPTTGNLSRFNQYSYPASQLKNFIGLINKTAPKCKVTGYTTNSVSEKSDLFKKHPDWVVHGKNGKPTTTWSDEGTVMNRNLTPACADYMVNQYKRLVSDFGFDVIYVDGGDGGEEVDWKTHRVTHCYDWLEMWRRVREEIQGVNPETGIFMNSMPGLHSDMVYMEMGSPWRAHFIGRDWREFASWAKNTKMWASRQDIPVSPLNWLPWDMKAKNKPEEGNNEPWYTNYLMGYGFIAGWPELADPYEGGSPIRSLNSRWFFVDAAYEIAGTISASGVKVSPAWWREETPDLEADVLKASRNSEKSYWFPLISHAKEKKTFHIQADAAAMGLSAANETVALTFTPPDPRNIKGGDWHWLVVTKNQTPFTFSGQGNRLQLEMSAELEPELLKSILITQQMGLVYAVNGKVRQFPLPYTKDVSVVGTCVQGASSYSVEVNSAKYKAVVMLLIPAQWASAQVAVNGVVKPVTRLSSQGSGGERFLVVEVPQGKSKFTVEKAHATAWSNIPELK